MDLSTIIEILIGLTTILGTIFANIIQNSRRDEIHDERLNSLERLCNEKFGNLDEKIWDLGERVDIHNHLVERMYQVESSIKILEKEDKKGDKK
jgi:hypothetical protein